jgi:hypothetical protein
MDGIPLIIDFNERGTRRGREAGDEAPPAA